MRFAPTSLSHNTISYGHGTDVPFFFVAANN
jgi:hypothetical protein